MPCTVVTTMNNVIHGASYSIATGIDLVVTQHFRYPKINNLRIHIRIQEDVAWFQIQMDNALLMEAVHALGYPLNYLEK